MEELIVGIITFIQCSGLFICRGEGKVNPKSELNYVESLSTKVLHQKKDLLT